MKVVMVIVAMVILLLMRMRVSALLSNAVVATQQHHQPTNGNLSLTGGGVGKRWAPTEIRMNEFIHKIRSRFNGQSAGEFVRRAAKRVAAGKMGDKASKTSKHEDRRAEKSNRGAAAVKLYGLRTRWGRIPSVANAGDK